MKLDAGAARTRRTANSRRRSASTSTRPPRAYLTLINANMANAIRSRTVQKGIDPRGFALVAFGGAGPLHGADVAAMLEIPEVIVPPYPGITSAIGLLTTDLKYDAIRTQFQVSGRVDLDQLNADLNEMEARSPGNSTRTASRAPMSTFRRSGDLRYVGQGYELKIALAGRRDRRAGIWRSSGATFTRRTPPNMAMLSRRARSRSSMSASAASAAMPKLKSLSRARGRLASRRRGFARSLPVPRRGRTASRSRRPSTSARCCRSASVSPDPPSCCKRTARPSCRRARPPSSIALGQYHRSRSEAA